MAGSPRQVGDDVGSSGTYQVSEDECSDDCVVQRSEDRDGFGDAGCRSFNLIPQAPDIETAVEGAAEVKRLLATSERSSTTRISRSDDRDHNQQVTSPRRNTRQIYCR